MHLQGSPSSSSEEHNQEPRENPSMDNDPMEDITWDFDATTTERRHGSSPPEKKCRKSFQTPRDNSSRNLPPPRSLEQLFSSAVVPSSIEVPSPTSNEHHGVEATNFPARAMPFDYPYARRVSVASSVEAEPSQEPETREYQRNFRPTIGKDPFQARKPSVQQQQTANKEKTTAMAAGLATTLILTIFLGTRIGLMAGLFAAYAHDKEGILGDISRALGEIALITREKAITINTKHKLVHRVRFALLIGWECATTIDRKNNAFMNMIVHGDIVWTNLVDAFYFDKRFQYHSFFRDLNNGTFTPLGESFWRHVDDDTTAPFDIEPIDQLLRAR